MIALTVGDLREAIKDLPNETKVHISYETDYDGHRRNSWAWAHSDTVSTIGHELALEISADDNPSFIPF